MREVRITLMTNLNFQARAPKNQLGQTAVAGNEGIEVPHYDQPNFFRQEHPAPCLGTASVRFLLILTYFLPIFTHVYP